MKIELTHDIIAEKAWELLPETEKELRRVQQMVERRMEAFGLGEGPLLTARELEAYERLFPQLKLGEAEWGFIRESEAEVERRAAELKAQRDKEHQLRVNAQRWLRTAVILFSVLLLAGLGFYQYQQVQRHFEQGDNLRKAKDFAAARIAYQKGREGSWGLAEDRAHKGIRQLKQDSIEAYVDSLLIVADSLYWKQNASEGQGRELPTIEQLFRRAANAKGLDSEEKERIDEKLARVEQDILIAHKIAKDKKKDLEESLEKADPRDLSPDLREKTRERIKEWSRIIDTLETALHK